MAKVYRAEKAPLPAISSTVTAKVIRPATPPMARYFHRDNGLILIRADPMRMTAATSPRSHRCAAVSTSSQPKRLKNLLESPSSSA